MLKVIKPLYKIPKAGNYWFNIYYTHHIKELQMSQLTYNLYLLYINTNMFTIARFKVVGLQTDNILFIKNNMFTKAKQDKLKFQIKPHEILIKDHSIKFNRGLITLINSKLFFN